MGCCMFFIFVCSDLYLSFNNYATFEEKEAYCFAKMSVGIQLSVAIPQAVQL